MKHWKSRILAAVILSLCAELANAQQATSWRYYRPGNTGIQGDYNEAIYVDTDGDPWISGYNPVAEEGGIAKFVQAENRWINVSNVDYPVIGSANVFGTSRVSDMVADGQGNLWLGTWRGALRMNLASGPSSLVKFGPENSVLPGGLTRDVTLAPDGTIWVSAEAVSWAGGGLTRYDPATDTWTHFAGHGGGKIAAQPKPGGGYYIWTALGGYDGMARWDSITQAWTNYLFGPGQPAALVSLDSADESGNVWMTRWIGIQGEQRLDCIRPNGTWVSPPLPPPHPQVPVAALRAFGNLQALMVDGYAHLHRFDGTAWTDLGPVPHDWFIDDLDIDAVGNVWLCGTGTGGALRRDAVTGFWQRYRVTNTSQFDFFNNDVAIDSLTGDVYACANAASSIGGMVKFDGTRWTGFVTDLGYGLTGPWPFPGAPQSEAVYVRPSNGHVVVNPINSFTHEFDGTSWTSIPGGQDQMRQYVEDSIGRLWGIGHYGGLGIFENGGYTNVGTGGGYLRRDPDRPGTVWCGSGSEIVRTDGTYLFSRTMADFPAAAAIGSSFAGLAVDHNGIAWVGTIASTSAGSTLIRLDANTGTHQMWEHDLGWPFPAEHVAPLLVTPDGRLWMTYDSEYPSTDAGLLWWDGTQVGVFPAPPNGAWQWGGLPHAGILDIEVKLIPGGYELWMSCIARGIAVLTVPFEPAGTIFCSGDGIAPHTACPCGNASTLASQSGCLHSLGVGATLRASGTASLANDTLVFQAASLPATSVLFLQGTLAANGGNGVVLGDGLRCVAGSLIRLKAYPASGAPGMATASYPQVGDLSVSVRGGISLPGTFTYQAWYRDPAVYCAAEAYNLSNGLEVTWGP